MIIIINNDTYLTHSIVQGTLTTTTSHACKTLKNIHSNAACKCSHDYDIIIIEYKLNTIEYKGNTHFGITFDLHVSLSRLT